MQDNDCTTMVRGRRLLGLLLFMFCFAAMVLACSNTDACADITCESGVCSEGVCQNPSECTADADCDEGVCEAGICVDAADCTGGECDKEAYCEQLACERGVCSFAEQACVNAQDCQGDDARCTDGYVCDGTTCVEDLCEANGVDCSDGGVCVPELGECRNAESCATESDCVADYLCVDAACVPQDAACGADGCSGNQVCEYDADQRTATCVENQNEACSTSLDCTGERQCAGQVCMEPSACAADAFEPNATAQEATDFNTVAGGLAVDASICAGDADVYTVDMSKYPNMPLRGTLVVSVSYARRDIGLGELAMKVTDSRGSFEKSDTAGAMGAEGSLEVTHELNAASSRQFIVEVADAGDLAAPGVHYTLSVDIIESDTLSACEQPTELVAGQFVYGDTNAAPGYGFGSSCTSLHNPSREELYTFTLDTTSEVTLNVLPADPSKDFAVSVRESCERVDSELACENRSTEGGELLQAVLGEGTYFVMVETGPEELSGGRYSLTYRRKDATCSPSDNACTAPGTALVCDDDGLRLSSYECTFGCEPTTGTCIRREADTCDNPTPLEDGASVIVAWSELEADVQMSAGSCLGYGAAELTAGPDAVYSVRLQANATLTASLDFAGAGAGAVYVVSSCESAASTCLAGDKKGDDLVRTSTYTNTSGYPQTVYVIADSISEFDTTATLTIDLTD